MRRGVNGGQAPAPVRSSLDAIFDDSAPEAQPPAADGLPGFGCSSVPEVGKNHRATLLFKGDNATQFNVRALTNDESARGGTF
jgi:hypothetical protein